MTRSEIIETMYSILRDKWSINDEVLAESNINTPLTGEVFNLKGRDLVYLLVFTKETFAVEIPGAELADEGFNSVSSIAGIVERARAASETA